MVFAPSIQFADRSKERSIALRSGGLVPRSSHSESSRLRTSEGMIIAVARAVSGWLDRLDPGVHRRIKGLRLVTAFGIAWMASTMPGIALSSPSGVYLGAIAAGFALWASVS